MDEAGGWGGSAMVSVWDLGARDFVLKAAIPSTSHKVVAEGICHFAARCPCVRVFVVTNSRDSCRSIILGATNVVEVPAVTVA